MNIEEAVIETLKNLAPHEQQQVLNFARSLQWRGKTPLKEVRGLWADLGITITAEDIAEARRDMWGNFPREFPRTER